MSVVLVDSMSESTPLYTSKLCTQGCQGYQSARPVVKANHEVLREPTVPPDRAVPFSSLMRKSTADTCSYRSPDNLSLSSDDKTRNGYQTATNYNEKSKNRRQETENKKTTMAHP